MVGQVTLGSVVVGLLLAWFWQMSMGNPLTWLVVLFFWPFVLIFKIVVVCLPLAVVALLVIGLISLSNSRYQRSW